VATFDLGVNFNVFAVFFTTAAMFATVRVLSKHTRFGEIAGIVGNMLGDLGAVPQRSPGTEPVVRGSGAPRS